MKLIKLWTIQPLSFYQNLVQKGKVFSTLDNVDADFKLAYQWMANQMELRIGKKPDPRISPLWAWHQFQSEEKREPDLRCSGLLPKGSQGVRIEFEKEAHSVLLSDFSLWHHVLNNWFIDKESTRDEKIHQEHDLELNTNDEQTLIEDSWQKIFDLNSRTQDSADSFQNRSIQAALWSISLSEVKKVDVFIAR